VVLPWAPMTGTHAAAWYADPFGRHEARYFDGTRWTEHVSNAGVMKLDPVAAVSVVTGTGEAGPAGVAGFRGGGTILTEPVLVVNQKAKLYELTTEYEVFDGHGRRIGAVRDISQGVGRKGLRRLTDAEARLYRLVVVDVTGNELLSLTRPARSVRARVLVHDAEGRELGALVPQGAAGQVRFAIEVAESPIGSVGAESWQDWNLSVLDHTGTAVARITKSWAGLTGSFSAADHYAVEVLRPLPDPLRGLVVGAALGVDTALKQTHG
jgi:uncharacterized protein YxjI